MPNLAQSLVFTPAFQAMAARFAQTGVVQDLLESAWQNTQIRHKVESVLATPELQGWAETFAGPEFDRLAALTSETTTDELPSALGNLDEFLSEALHLVRSPEFSAFVAAASEVAGFDDLEESLRATAEIQGFEADLEELLRTAFGPGQPDPQFLALLQEQPDLASAALIALILAIALSRPDVSQALVDAVLEIMRTALFLSNAGHAIIDNPVVSFWIILVPIITEIVRWRHQRDQRNPERNHPADRPPCP